MNALKHLKQYRYSVRPAKKRGSLVLYNELTEAIDELEKALKPKLCGTCTRDHCGCSIQDSLLQIEPDATFDTFGCVHHEFNALLTEPSKHSTIQH